MTAISVVVPFGGGCPHRRAALDWLLPRLPEWDTVVGTCEGPWSKAVAVADAADRTAAAEVLVVHDADVWVPADALRAAVDALDAGHRWAIPHRKVHRLTEAATAVVLAGGEPAGPTEQLPYLGHPGGGIVVLPADLYDDVPLDPRFVGWGQEDDAWAAALTSVAGPCWRGAADLVHLWHPAPVRRSRTVGTAEGAALCRRYVAARRRPSAMRALLTEAKEAMAWPRA